MLSFIYSTAGDLAKHTMTRSFRVNLTSIRGDIRSEHMNIDAQHISFLDTHGSQYSQTSLFRVQKQASNASLLIYSYLALCKPIFLFFF
jgi:hypothetical protein